MQSNGQASSSGDAGSKPVVCFLGPVSSYTHQATLETFPPDQFDLMPVATIKDIFDTTQAGAATYGVVPFENSTNGAVVFTLDYFADRSGVYTDLNVCREIYLDVHHCLLGHIAPAPASPRSSLTDAPSTLSSSSLTTALNSAETAAAAVTEADDDNKETSSPSGQRTPTAQQPHPGESRARPLHPVSHVRRVYSHPQAFGQCGAFLGSWLRGVDTVDVSSTSRAAELALADPSGESAAVSSAVAAELLGLDVLARDIEDRDDNTTRFFVLRRGVGGDDDDDDGSTAAATAAAASTSVSPSAEPTIIETRSETEGEGGRGGGGGGEVDEDDDTALLSSTKSLLSFTVPHSSPGALADVLSCFRRGGLNLTSISSRPSLAAAFEYVFFVEFGGHRFRDPRGRVARVLADVAAASRTSRWLGSWEDMRRRKYHPAFHSLPPPSVPRR
ncbi:Prephenate dehydratase-domain-containing protein [Nemania sp. NC0429]|nr:Prephenate dehydratase-domain-containing protein [Nemania sp. NC0429]